MSRMIAGVVVCCLALAGSAFAQGNTVPVAGMVRDASGGAVNGTVVEVVVADRVVASTTSGDDGRYQVQAPTNAPFALRARRDGFAVFETDLRSGAGGLTRDITLQIGGISDTLVVTASGNAESRTTVTSSVSVMTSEDAHAIGAHQLSEVLQFVPGFWIEGTGREGGLISAFSRGGESDYNLVLIDGVRVNTQGGYFDFSRIGTGEFERVEVIRGAQSALWGSDAMGSVVQVFTKRAEASQGPRLSGSFEGGEFNTFRGDAHLTGWAGRRLDYQVGTTYRKTDGAFGDILPQDDWFEQKGFDAGLGVTLGSRASVRTNVRTSNTQGRTVGPITFGARDTQGSYDTKNISWATDLSHSAGSRFTGRATVNYFYYSQLSVDTFGDAPYSTYAVLEGTPNALFPNGVRLVRLVDQAEFNTLVAAGATPGAGQFLASATSFDFPTAPNASCPSPARCPTIFERPAVRYQGDLTLAAGHRLSAGYEWEREAFELDPRNPLSVSTGFGLDNNAIFVQEQSSFADRWFVTAGIRVDDKESYDTFVSPKLSVGGFIVPVRPGGLSSVKVYGNIGKGIKSPGFGERFGSGFADPNPGLKVEEARTGDVGVEATFGSQRFRGAVTYFNNDYKNQIAFRSGTVGDGLPEFINIDGSEADGWEIEGALQRAVRGFSILASYSNVDTRVVTAISTSQQFQPGQPLLRRPRHSGYVRAAYSIGRAAVSFDVRAVGERHDNSFLFMRTVPNAQYPTAFGTDITVNPGYTIAGLGVDVRLDQSLSVYLRANNITDKAYDTALGYPGMPRQVMVGARFDLGRRR